MTNDIGIDCDYTEEITCPYCGWTDSDSWEKGLDEEETEWTCGAPDCEKEFLVVANIKVSYSSSRKDCKDDKHHYGVVEKRDTTQDDLDRYKREGSCLSKYITAPETTWYRKCVDCEDQEHRKVPLGEECPADLLALPSFVDAETTDA